jgi:replicative DNA helicase
MPNSPSQAETQGNTAQKFKLPPHASQAEIGLLGCLLVSPSSIDKVADLLQPQDFYHPEHPPIFEAMLDLANQNKPCDALIVADHLKSKKKLKAVGGESYLFKLADGIATASNIVHYANIIREHAMRRRCIQASHEMMKMAQSQGEESADQLLEQLESKIFSLRSGSERNEDPQNINRCLAIASDKIDLLHQSGDSITGLETGFKELNNLTAGLQPGDLFIVAGRPSMGKTVFGVNLAEHAALSQKKPVLIFSLEMPTESITMRMLSSLGRINQHRIRTGKLNDNDWPKLTSAISMLSNAPLFIDDTPALTPSELRAKARRISRQHGNLGLIVVDYLQLMRIADTKENRTMEISEISRTLKALAKEMKCPVVACSQLNRSLEQRQDKRPMMSDLRESGAIEQDADVIAFIYRDEVYNENSADKGLAEIIIAKHRNGPIGKIKLAFLGEFTRFDNYASETLVPIE